MKISVITISYNAASCIESTINSVIAQKYDDFEYIIVDGVSKDGTLDIIQKYDKSISHWVSEPDSGIYNAMNKAVRMATGEYCIFMNAGDMFANPLVLKQVSLFLDDDFDVLTGCEISTVDGKPFAYVEPIKEITKEHFFLTSISHQASFIKRTLLLEFPYDEDLKLVSDWKFWLETIVFGGKSYRPMDVDVCVFNHDGLTYSPGMKKQGKMERENVISEFYCSDDIKILSKRYNGWFNAQKRRIKFKIEKKINLNLIKTKLKTYRAYMSVLGFPGLLIGFLHYLSPGGALEQQTISKFIKRRYKRCINSRGMEGKHYPLNVQNPIWVLWWQGEKMMPMVPKICLKKLRENVSDKSQIIFIDKYNYYKYINIPDYILEKVEKGFLSITNLSDIIRFGLLAKFGGLWIDSTCYTQNMIPNKLFTLPFYSSSKPCNGHQKYISNYRWASYLLGGNNRKTFSTMFNLFLEYVKQEKYFVDYLLLDYFLNLIYESDKEMRADVDNMGYINQDILDMSNHLNDEYDGNLQFDNIFYKLSWKLKYVPYTNNKLTIWGKIINELI